MGCSGLLIPTYSCYDRNIQLHVHAITRIQKKSIMNAVSIIGTRHTGVSIYIVLNYNSVLERTK